MKILIYAVLILLGAVILLCVIIRNLKSELKLVRAQLATTEKEKDGYAKQVQRLMSAAEIMTANEKEANEKIDEVYSGDAVDNALSGLSKHKD